MDQMNAQSGTDTLQSLGTIGGTVVDNQLDR